MSIAVVDPFIASRAVGATGLLRTFNDAGVPGLRRTGWHYLVLATKS